jgi:sporulation protein YlmC with PRC-barrel domain
MTEFTIGAEASCSDGPCGKITRLIVEPDSKTVTHLVIQPGHHPAQARIVPLRLVQSAAGQVMLSCSRAEFDKLDPAEEVQLAPGDTTPSSYMYDPVGAAHISVPPPFHPQILEPKMGSIGLGSYDGPRHNLPVWHGRRLAAHDSVPAGEVDVERGESVSATDGHIGQIHGLVIDPDSHGVTHILLEEGHLWGHKQVAIPISKVTRLGDVIRLSISKQDVQELPPVDIEHPGQ